jgi:hypothetical protein
MTTPFPIEGWMSRGIFTKDEVLERVKQVNSEPKRKKGDRHSEKD